VSIKFKLRMLLLYLPLLAGSLSGVPMRPEDMDQIMGTLNQERIEYVIPDDSENGDDTIKEVKKVIEGQQIDATNGRVYYSTTVYLRSR
jgi:hypothetical protein